MSLSLRWIVDMGMPKATRAWAYLAAMSSEAWASEGLVGDAAALVEDLPDGLKAVHRPDIPEQVGECRSPGYLS